MEENPLNDKNLEKKAATDSNAREKLRQAVGTTAVYQAQGIIKVKGLDIAIETELVGAGMSVFDTAFNLYIKNGQTIDESMNFSPYFGWWARQAMIEFLKTKTFLS
jgi:hypothetical protein